MDIDTYGVRKSIKQSKLMIHKQTLISCSGVNMRSHKTYLLFALLVVGIIVTDAKPPQKLLSSTSAQPGELKYQVSLKRGNYHVCGGTLISNRHVLTAAHCFVGRSDPPYTEGLVLITGMTKISVGGEEHLPKYVTVHPNYVKGDSTNRWRHDIAVVTLATPARTNSLQAPISLPSTNLTENVTGVVSGWGQLSKGLSGKYPDDLKKSSVTIITLKDCKERNQALETQICGFDGKGTGFCEGDSGGPLVYNNEIVGVVSFGVSCGIGYPDIYTRVYAYKDFIETAMQRV